MAPPIRVSNGEDGMTTTARRRSRTRRRTTGANRPGAATGGTTGTTLHAQQLKRTYWLGTKHGIEQACDFLNIPVPPGMLPTRV
jgi:hypothetical protein